MPSDVMTARAMEASSNLDDISRAEEEMVASAEALRLFFRRQIDELQRVRDSARQFATQNAGKATSMVAHHTELQERVSALETMQKVKETEISKLADSIQELCLGGHARACDPHKEGQNLPDPFVTLEEMDEQVRRAKAKHIVLTNELEDVRVSVGLTQRLLGIKFEPCHQDLQTEERQSLRLSFEHLDMANPERVCSCRIQIICQRSGRKYVVDQVTPPLPEGKLNALVENLNSEPHSLNVFVRALRRCWKLVCPF